MVAQLENDKNIQVVKKPVAGEVREVAVGSELDVSFDFDLGSVQAAKDGDDLVLTFEDESVVKLLGFANELEPIDVVLQDGTVISAEAIMEAIGDDGFINTAAGAASSSPQGSGSSSLEGFGEALSGIENQEINHSYDDSSRAFVSSDVTGVENTPVVAIDDSSSVLAAELTNILDGAANPSVSGNVLSNDIDPDGDTLSVTGSTSNAQYGTFVINKDGTWTYTLDNQNGDIVALDDGESRTDSITYTVSDGLSSDTATLTVTINGTNDAPTVVADAGGVTAEEYHDVNANILDVPTASGNVLDNDSDLDIEDITVLDPGTYEGSYGTLVIGEYGSWTYTLDPNNPDVQGLNIGSDPLHDTFKYSATDGTASTESELVIDVHGTNDRPEVAAATVDGVTESFVGKEIVADVTEQAARTPENDAEDIGGVLTFTDVDNNDHGNAEAAGGLDLTYNWSVNGGDASVVTADGLAGEYGSLTYNVSTGRWDYTLNDANAQQLGEGQSFDETFQISVDDGHGGTEVQNIVVTVNGTNDAPEVAAATVDGVTESFVGKEIVADVTEQAARTPENDAEDIGGVLTFTDVDNNDHGNAEAAGGLDLTYNWSVNGGDASVVTADGLAGEYGSLTYNVSTGRWDYTLNDANAQQLGEGQSFDETFQISVDDGHGGTEVQNIVVTVNGTNDAPEVAAATVDGVTESFVGKEIVADVTEQAARTPENDAEDIGGVLTFTDVDNNDHGNAEAAGGLDLTYNWSVNGGDASVVTADGLAGEYGSLTYNVSTGRWDYTLNDANAQQLGEGQSFDETFQISVDDGHGGTEVQNIVVTVNGTNDAPEVAAATVDGVTESFVGKEIVADVTEQAARTPENDVEDIGGVLTFTDVDNNDHGNAEAAGGLDLTYNWSVNGGDASVVTADGLAGEYGSLTYNVSTGRWDYTLNDANAQQLGEGQSFDETFQISVDDGHGGTEVQNIVVTVNGTNDAPEVAAATVDGVTESFVGKEIVADVTEQAACTPENDAEDIGGVLTFTDVDNNDHGNAEAAGGLDLTYNWSVNGGDASVVTADGLAGEYGSLTYNVSTGRWDYTLNDANAQQLGEGQSFDETFQISVDDGHGGTEVQNIVVTVNGTNDAPEVAAATVDGVTESFVGKEIVADVTEQAARTPENDAEDIGGVLTFTDVDNNDHGNAEAAGGLDLTYNWSVNGGDASVVTADGLAGEYGSLTYNVSTGRWDYTLNDANAQQLGEGQSFDETFQISVDDGHGGTEVQNIVVTVNGTNDAPELAAATVDGVTESFVGKEIVADVTEQAARTPENDVEDIGGVLTFTDVDNNDHGNAEAAGGLDLTYNWSVNGGDASVVTADGLAGEYGSLTYNVSTGRWDYTLNDANAQQLGEGQSFDETFQISVDDGHGGTEVQNIVVTVNGTNDAPEVAAATVDGVTESFVGKEIVADVTEQAARTPENDAEDIGGVLTFTDVDNNDHGNAEAAGGLDLTYNWSVNGGDASVVTADGLAGEYGSLTYNVSTGRWDYTLNDANAQQLGEGQSFDETFQISVDDGHGGTEVQNIVVTVNGTNDAPEVAAATVDGVTESFVGKEIVADVTEQAARTPENDVEDIGGVLTFTDVDNNDHGNAEAAGGLDLTYNWSVNGGDASVVTADGLAGEYGSLTYNVSTGRWDYTLNDANAQQLGEGQSFDETFQISVDDGHGGTEVQNIVVTVNGTNDAPEVAAATVDGVTESFVGKEIVADVTEQAACTPENDAEDIGGVLTFTDVDNNDHGNAEAAGGLDLTYNWSVNGGDASVVTADGLAGEYGSLTYNVSTGRWDYTLNDANAQQLGEGQSFDETFQISVDDGHGGTEVQNIVVTVNGTNDAPEVAAATVDGVTESFVGKEIVADVTEQAARTPENDAEDIGGVLTFTDVDNNDHGNAEAAGGLDLTYNWSVNGGDASVVTADGLAGEYGSLTYNVSTGRWDYTLNDANAQQLGEGQSFDETFQISVDDGHGGTEVQNIVVTVNGTNDAPEVAAATVDGVTESFVGKEIVADVTEQAARTPENDVEDIGGVLTFTDVDNNDHGNAEAAGGLDLTYNWSVNGGDASVVTADGLAGEYGSLTYNVSTGRWDYTLNDANAQQLGEGQSFDETFQISVDDGHGGTEVQNIVVTVNGTNDAPEVAAATVDGVTESFVGKEIVADVTEQAARTPENDAEDIGGVLTFTDVDNNDHGNAEAAGGLDLTYNWSVNGGDASVVTADGLAGEYGSLTYNVSTGRWDYTLNDANAQQLGEGQSFDETFQISVDDGHGGTEVQNIVVTVNGTNDAPVVAEATNSETGQTFAEGQDITGTVTESGQWEAGDSSATGTLTFTDPDRNDEGNAEVGGSGSLTYQVSSDLNTSSSDLYDQNDSQNNDSLLEVVGKYGNLTYDTENGTWTYTLDNDREATKELIDGQEVHESFTVVATDDAGASVEKVIDVEVNGSTDLTEYTLTFEGQSAGWTNALVVAVTYPDGTTEFVAPGVNSDTDSWLISDWNNSKDIDEGSTLQFTVREDATVEYFLIPRVTEDKLNSMTYENGTVKYTNEHGDTVDAVSNMKVPGEEYGNTDSTTYRVEDGGGTDYNDFVFSEDKQDADFTLSGTTKADVLHGTTEADVLNGGPELGGLHSSELLPDGSFDALGADSSVRSSSNNGSENANLNSNGWSTESSLEVWHRGDGEDRNYFVELDSNTHKDGNQNYRESDLSRDIATKAGQEYTLSFKAAARESGEKMYVIIDGHEYEVRPSDYTNNDSSDWDTYSITFTAKDSSTRITLGQHESQNTGQHHIGIFVDDIAVTDDAGDELYGHAGNDTLNGGLGDDLLVGGAGADTLIGGEGFDTASYAGDNGGEGITAVASDDGLTISGGDADGDSVEGVEALIGSDHRDIITLDNDWKNVDAGNGMDMVEINDSDGIDGVHVDLGEGGISYGPDSGAEIAKFVSNQAIKATADGGTGLDALEVDKEGALSAVITAATTDGEGFNVSVTAADGTEILGKNFEQLKFNSASDVNVTIKDNVGHVDLYTAEDKVTETTITSESNVGKISVTTGDEADTVTIQDQGGSFDKELDLHTWSGNDEVTVSGNNVTGSIDTGVGTDTIDLSGINSGVVTINSGDGSDTIYAGSAQEIINGGDGDFDTVSYAKSDAGVTVDLVGENNEGTGDAQGDSYNSIENFVGSEQADTFIADIADTHSVNGGTGFDTIDYSQSSSGVKLVASGSDWSVSENVIGASTTGTIEGFENFIGTDQVDSVTMTGANSGTVAFSTGGGNDDIDLSVTNSGNITVNAGAGENDVNLAGVNSGNLTVAAGSDSDDIDVNMVNSDNLTINAGGGDNDIDVVATNSGTLIVNAGVGNDTISLEGVSSGNATINSGGGNDEIDLTGMTSGSVTVNAGDGSDTMLAGAATETFNGGSDVASVDTVNYAASKSAVNVDLSDANHDGIADARGSGGDAAGDSYSSIENITGSNHADTLTGNDFGNVIRGGDGAADGAILTEDFDGHGTHNWVATSGSKEINTHGIYNPGTKSGQNNVLEIDAERAVDAISTKVETVAGQEYVFTFKALTRDHSNAEQNEELIVKIGDEEFILIPTRDDQSNDTDNLFETYSLRFTGTGGETAITFTELESQSRSTHGVLVDDIALYAIDDIINGGGGNDTIFGEGGNDFLSGGDGSDFLHGGAGYDVAVYDGDFSDYTVTQNVDEAGHTYYTVGKGAEIDTVYDVESLQFNDRTLSPVEASIHDVPEGLIINGSSIDDSLNGKEGNDDISGKGGQDELHGHGGDDILHGGNGDDYLYGGSGKDSLYGDQGQDHLYGDDGNDTLKGVQGDDHLYGGSGEDTLYGGQGQDHLNGGAGDNDILNGGSGDDIFLFTADDFQKSGETTIIKDYGNGHDRLQFSDVISGSGEEQYAVSDVSHSGGDTTFTVTATQAGSTEALTHTIVLQDDISMDHAYLQHLLNSGS